MNPIYTCLAAHLGDPLEVRTTHSHAEFMAVHGQEAWLASVLAGKPTKRKRGKR